MTTPVPLTSLGLCLVHGWNMSGIRIVAEILTTDSRMALSSASPCGWAARAGRGPNVEERSTHAPARARARAVRLVFIAGARLRVPHHAIAGETSSAGDNSGRTTRRAQPPGVRSIGAHLKPAGAPA